MVGAARKELEVRMVFTGDTAKASQAVRELTRDLDRAGVAMKSLNMGGGAGPAPAAGAAGGGGPSIGVWAAAGQAAAPLAAAAAFAGTAANLVKAVQQLDAEFLTAREKAIGFANAIPVIGGALASLTDSILDAADRLFDEDRAKRVDRLRYENPISMAQAATRHEFGVRRSGMEREVREAGFRAQAVREFPTVAAGLAVARNTFGGTMFGGALGASFDAIDPRLMGNLEAIQAARAGVRSAELAAGAAAADVDALRPGAARTMDEWRRAKGASGRSLEAAMDAPLIFGPRVKGVLGAAGRFADRGLDAWSDLTGLTTGSLGTYGGISAAARAAGITKMGGKPGDAKAADGSDLSLAEAALKEQRAMQAALLAQQELEAKIGVSKERQLELTRKQHELAKAETALLRTKSQILDEQYAKARMGERQFGLISSSEQGGVLEALERFTKLGREGITQDELSILMGSELTREFVGKQAERDVKGNPLLRRIREITGERDSADLKVEADKARAEVALKMQFDEEKFAKLLADTLKKFNFDELLAGVIKNQLEIMLRKPEFEARAGRFIRAGGG